jgi:small-conductance mechanosensitive channel
MLAAALLAACLLVAAAAPPPAPSPAPPLLDPANVSQTLTQIGNQLATVTDDKRLAGLEAQAASIQSQAEALAAQQQQARAPVEASLKRYSPARVRRLKGADAQTYAGLKAQAAALEAQARQAQAMAAAAGRTVSLVAERRREGFSARILEQTPSPLSPDFWTSLAASFSADIGRLDAILDDAVAAALRTPLPWGPLKVLAGLLGALIVFFPVRLQLERLGRSLSAKGFPGPARKALAAAWILAADALTPPLAAALLRLGAEWGEVLSPDADALAGALVQAVGWGAAVLALARVLATDPNPAQRLLAISDDDAAHIRLAVLPVALVTAAGVVIRQVTFIVGASVAATIAANCVLSLAYAGAGALILSSYRRREADGQNSPAWTLISLAMALAIAATIGAVFSGYTTLAALISGQMFWLGLIAGVAFLLLRLIDSVMSALFKERGPAVHALSAIFGLRTRTVMQAGLLISAGLEVAVVLAAVMLALTPFGQSGELLVKNFAQLGGDIRIGQARISPAAIAEGLAAFAVGMGIVHVAQNWVTRRYLPVTGWDAGLRNSVATGVGYLGVVISALVALAVMGLGFSQIAFVAGALSVGIGFGLQQIVQNFVSGVILLVERPVKVGDWVVVGGVEGDVRRIRVRATEIQTFDASTVIVPNSSLITSNVENKTAGADRGRIHVQLNVNAADAEKTERLVLEAAKAVPEILADPPPVVFFDALAAGGAVTLKAYLYVADPRNAQQARSGLLRALLAALEQNGVTLV